MLRKLWFVTAFLGLAGLSVANVHAEPASGDNSLLSNERNQTKLFVLNADAVAHATGTVVIYYPSATYPGITVSTTATANSPYVAGVVVDKALPASGYGWIATHGYAVVNMQETCTAGDTIITSTTAEKGGIYTTLLSTGQVTSLNTSRLGIALVTSSAGNCKAVLMR